MLSIHPDVITRLRNFAKEPGALFLSVKGPNGNVPVWADDVNAAMSDDALREVIAAAVNREQPVKKSNA